MDGVVTLPDELSVLTAAIATPLRPDESLDEGVLFELTTRYLERGIEGLYCCGSSGEGVLLSTEERKRVVATVARAVGGRVPVVAHIGGGATRDAIELGRHAAEAGVTAVSMIPPTYYRFGQDAVVEHYAAVMRAVELPMIVYNIPQFTGTEFTPESIRPLLENDQVVGVKHTAHNMFSLQQMAARFPGKAFINGFDEVFVASLAAGARGTIGTTVGLQYELFAAARRRFDSGDVDGARQVQGRINDIIRELVDIDVFPAAKYVSGRDAAGLGSLGSCRRPFVPLSQAARARLDRLDERLTEYLRLTAHEERSARV
ncbi:dihydrodipicolinate synthase family protein [Pseudactinotalea sp. HY158]|uniref:dihydrodipicolinate synthase family protein n=1 Tax=Pseudactinotalea sp. HY158 TaxID=2654547 RepID=UPI00351A6A6D